MRRIRVKPKMVEGNYVCTECKSMLIEEDTYCPECGALIIWKKKAS